MKIGRRGLTGGRLVRNRKKVGIIGNLSRTESSSETASEHAHVTQLLLQLRFRRRRICAGDLEKVEKQKT